MDDPSTLGMLNDAFHESECWAYVKTDWAIELGMECKHVATIEKHIGQCTESKQQLAS